MVIGDPVVEDTKVVSGNIIARNDLPKTTFSKSQIEKQYRPELSFFRNSGTIRFELANNKRSVMLTMRPATQEKNANGRPIYDNQSSITMSLKQTDLQSLIYFMRYAPEIEKIEPVKLYHKRENDSKCLSMKYNTDNGTFNISLDGKSKAWITLSSQEILGIELLLSHLFLVILGF